mgnify:CR=1 FL=1
MQSKIYGLNKMVGRGKNTAFAKFTKESLSRIQDSLGNDFDGMSFQIDLINSEITPRPEIVNFLNENSQRLEHLLDKDPKLIRWWFSNFEIAIKVMLKLSDEDDLNYRLVCVERKTLFIEVGDVSQLEKSKPAMTKNQKTLFDLLTAKGFEVKTVYYYPTYGYLPDCGWVATVVETDEEGLIYDQEYHLGNDFKEAKGQIENDEIRAIND